VSFDELLRNAPAYPESPRIEATLRNPDPLSWGRFFIWLAIGAVYAIALVGIASIGLFVLPFAVIGTALVMRRTNGKEGLFGLLSGAGYSSAVRVVSQPQGSGDGVLLRKWWSELRRRIRSLDLVRNRHVDADRRSIAFHASAVPPTGAGV